MTNEQMAAHIRAVRQNAVAQVATCDLLLAHLQPAPQEPEKVKPRWLGDPGPTSEPNGEVADG